MKYSVGSGGSATATAPPFELYRVERGGEVTYHAPGQIVCYPLLDLRSYRRDLHWYVRRCEEVVIRTLASACGLRGTRRDGTSGVWVDGHKVSAVGINVSRWMSSHGFSLNIDSRVLPGFDRIIPCGLEDVKIGAVQQWTTAGSTPVTTQTIRSDLVKHFSAVFNVNPHLTSISSIKQFQPKWLTPTAAAPAATGTATTATSKESAKALNRRKLLEVLRDTRTALARPNNDFSWASWKGHDDCLAEMDGLIETVGGSGALPARMDVRILYVATGPVQETAISSGWSEEYMTLAGRADDAIAAVYDSE